MSASLRWTSVELCNFPKDGRLREIIAGELYVSSRPHFYHQVLCATFAGVLSRWGASAIGQAVCAPGLIFSPEDDVAPDVVWVSLARLPHILRDGKLRAAPELVVEVLALGASNIARDREAKLRLYSRRAVEEYWIADWRQRRVEVYRRECADLFRSGVVASGDTLTSQLLPGFAVPLDHLFRGIPADAHGDG